MTIQELQTILSFAQVDRNQKVRVFVTSKSGMKEYCDILSYNTFCDGIVLTIESDLLEREGNKDAALVVPELKENENERIRKHIIEVFKERAGYVWKDGTTNDECLAYLEKQKEENDKRLERVEQHSKRLQELDAKIKSLRRKIYGDEQELAGWSEEDETNIFGSNPSVPSQSKALFELFARGRLMNKCLTT